jgi:hypothetical protein
MSVRLEVSDLTLVTPSNRFSYSFDLGMNVVVGEIGSGKSSLLELIKFALGGNASLTPAVRQGVRRVVLSIRIGNSSLVFEREIGGRTLRATESDGTPIETLSVARSNTYRRSSDFLLDALDLPHLRVTNVNPSARSQPLGFFDLYAYCYVPQSEIDRSIVNHLDNLTRQKRVGAFEVLLGLTDESASENRVKLGQLNDEMAAARGPLAAIDEFLARTDTPSAEQLQRQQEELRSARNAAEIQLKGLRTETFSQIQTDAATALRNQLIEASRNEERVVARIHQLEAEEAQRRQLDADLEGELQRLARSTSASELLGGIAYAQCPRCLQRLSRDRFPADQCYVCGQSDVDGDDQIAETIEAEIHRIEALRLETQTLTTENEEEVSEQQRLQIQIRHHIDRLNADLDLQTREFVSPRYEAIESAAADRARSDAILEEIERSLRLWGERERLVEGVRVLEQTVVRTQLALDEATNRLSQRRGRIVDLSDVFDEIVQSLDMPWYSQGAYIDAQTYLPMVNGVSIENLGSGGMKMMTNVAYHLALLTFGLSTNLDSMPNLLIIDSPRKNLGVSEEDQAHAEAFYRWISALTQAYEGRFQLIVADNDPPPAGTPVTHRIDLSHNQPLVRDLEHPGEGVVTLGST